MKSSNRAFITFELLGKYADFSDSEKDIDLLLEILEQHPNPIVRHEAAAQLSVRWKKRPDLFKRIGPKVIKGLLRTATSDKSVVARHEAIESLGYLGDESIVSDLEKLAEDDNEDVSDTAKIAIDVVNFRKNHKASYSSLWRPMVATDH